MLVLTPLIVALLPLAVARSIPANPAPRQALADVETNGQRLARGLAPLKPKRNFDNDAQKRATTSSTPTTTTKGYLYAVQGASSRKRATTVGCVISDGTWYVGGTCATYTAAVTGEQATLSTSKGPCTITSAGVLSCASGNTASTFTLGSDGTLTYSGSSVFSADQVPASGTRQTVYTGASHAVSLTLNYAAGTTSTTSATTTSATATKTTATAYPTGTGLTVCSASDITSFPLSCSSDTVENTCCTDSPGGHLLQTQFWDTGSTSTGPNNSWTLHGLWPDNCDGTYQQYCDTAREYTNITQILQAAGQSATLDYMNTYWKDYQGDDESFWEHEWDKHGTCISSLEPTCFNFYAPQQEVTVYFNRAVSLFKTLPSYDWLAADGIVPSLTATYTLAQIQATLTKHHGYAVNVNCNGKVFDEIWYHYQSQGGIASGNIIPAAPVGSASTCPSTGIQYLPKYVSLT